MNNLAYYRKLRGYTQKELAEKIGLNSRTYISRIEIGKTALSLDVALKASEVLNTSIEELISTDAIAFRLRDKKISSKLVLATSIKDLTNNYLEAIHVVNDVYKKSEKELKDSNEQLFKIIELLINSELSKKDLNEILFYIRRKAQKEVQND